MNTEQLKARYDKRIDKTGTCWVWKGARFKDGYGKIRNSEDKIKLAHRVIYELYVWKIPDGLVLDHLCMNKPCVNPRHLDPVTQYVNIQRAFPKKKTSCPHGHAYDTENTYINPLGRYICRTCTRHSGKKYRERLKSEVQAVR